jgi:hypothetical protein
MRAALLRCISAFKDGCSALNAWTVVSSRQINYCRISIFRHARDYYEIVVPKR